MEKLEGVVIDDVCRCCRQTQRDGFEIVEHFAIGVVDGAMAFVDHDEIKKMGRKSMGLIANDVEHRRVRGNVDATIFGKKFFAIIGPAGLIGHVLLECSQCMFAQCNTVYQEQDFFGMASAHQCISHGNAGTGFAGTGGHNQKKITLLLFDAFQYRTYSPNLVVTPGDGGVDELLRQRLAIAADIGEALQIISGWEANDFARRVFP